MKRSLIIALIILVVGAVPAWIQRQRAHSLSVETDELRKKAASLGIDTSGGPAALAERGRRQREDAERKANRVTVEMLDLARELDKALAAGNEPDEKTEARAMEAITRLLELDPSQIRMVIESLKDDAAISDATRGNLISFSLLMLTDDQPRAAVELYSACADLLKKNPFGEHVLGAALGKWAEADPSGALEWLRRHSADQPELAGEATILSILAGTAVRDPARAFRMIGELGLDDPYAGIHSIVAAGADDDESRTDLIEALRGHLATVGNPAERDEISSKAMELLASRCDGPGFESLSRWIEQVNFSDTEKKDFAAGLSWYTTKAETGQWLGWLSENLPADAVVDPVKDLVGDWAQEDYVAAGRWLSAAPEGPARAAAVESYATAVAEYEPEIATQWALTLPPGPSRDATLRAIFENWPPNDPQGAGEFAREHGLE
jgi:hypothetical protein